MANLSKETVDPNSKLEDKTEILSHKVWDLQRSKNIVKIASDGSFNLGIVSLLQKTLKNNELSPTDYVNPDTKKRRVVFKSENKMYYSDFYDIDNYTANQLIESPEFSDEYLHVIEEGDSTSNFSDYVINEGDSTSEFINYRIQEGNS